MASKLLLDTNALIWILNGEQSKFGPVASKRIVDAHTVYVSSVSVFEMRLKMMTGKLIMDDDFVVAVEQSGFIELKLSNIHSDGISKFPGLSGHDPFDRLLISQALQDDLTLLTSDRLLVGLDLKYVADSLL
jgi:PIN domain nuclease of toxin-antitoxin system